MASTPTGADIAGAAPSPAMDPFQILMQKLDRMADDHQQELAGLKDQIQALVGVKEQVHTATEQVQIVQAEQASTTQQVHTVTEQVQVVQAELQVVRESTTQQDAEIQTLKDASTAQGVVLAQHTEELANIQPSVSTLLDDRINQIGGSIEERLCSQVAAKIETFATGNNAALASLNDRIKAEVEQALRQERLARAAQGADFYGGTSDLQPRLSTGRRGSNEFVHGVGHGAQNSPDHVQGIGRGGQLQRPNSTDGVPGFGRGGQTQRSNERRNSAIPQPPYQQIPTTEATEILEEPACELQQFFSASETLDPMFEPGPFEDDTQRKERELPDEVCWKGTRTMIPTETYSQQGIYQFLERFEEHCRDDQVRNGVRRVALLQRAIEKQSDKEQLRDRIASEKLALSRDPDYVEVRRMCLDLFCPPMWLQQTMKVFLKSVLQNERPGTIWLSKLTKWIGILNRLTPGEQPALSSTFVALLLRAGAAPALEAELAKIPYAAFKQQQAIQTIHTTAARLPDEGADTKLGKVNRVSAQLGLSAEDDAVIPVAVKMYRRIVAQANRVEYKGALRDWLMQQNVTESLFTDRKHQKLCVVCGAQDHFMQSCPKYVGSALPETFNMGKQ